MFSHIGLLNDWPSLASAAIPTLIVAVVAFFGLRRAELR
jgi:hypothetical protein